MESFVFVGLDFSAKLETLLDTGLYFIFPLCLVHPEQTCAHKGRWASALLSAPCWVKHGLGVAIQILGNFLVLFCHFTQEARVPSPNYCFKAQRIMILILKDNTFISIKKFKHYDSTSICLCFEWLHIYKVIVEKQKGEDDFLVAKKWEKVRNILWRSNSFLAIYNGNTLTCVSYFT